MLTPVRQFTAWIDRVRSGRRAVAPVAPAAPLVVDVGVAPPANPYNQDSPIQHGDIWIGSTPYLEIINERLTGDPGLHWFQMALRDHILPAASEDQSCLLLGSNEGGMEIALRQAGFQGRIVASDIADKALARAAALTAELGFDRIEHVQADLNRDGFPEASFDFVVAEGVLHHVENIDFCIANLRRALKPGGLLYAMEFVGPYRFQLPQVQIDWINAVLGAVPRRYRPVLGEGRPDGPQMDADRDHVRFAPFSVETMLALDPSEAVSGHLLMDAIGRAFDVELLREGGGGLLLYMVGHFPFRASSTDPACAAWVRVMAGIERVLYEQKIVPSDLVFLVARAKPAAD